MLKQIVLGELADEVDLVVDDACHAYEETKASFEFLFPLLQPGGIYLIEDWSWATTLITNHQMLLFPTAMLCLTSYSNKSCCWALPP